MSKYLLRGVAAVLLSLAFIACDQPPATTKGRFAYPTPMSATIDNNAPYQGYQETGLGSATFVRIDNAAIRPDRALTLYAQQAGEWVKLPLNNNAVIRNGYVLLYDKTNYDAAYSSVRLIVSWIEDGNYEIADGQASVTVPTPKEKVIDAPPSSWGTVTIGTEPFLQISDADIRTDRAVSVYCYEESYDDWIGVPTSGTILIRDGSVNLHPTSTFSDYEAIRVIVHWSEDAEYDVSFKPGSLSIPCLKEASTAATQPYTKQSETLGSPAEFARIDNAGFSPSRAAWIYYIQPDPAPVEWLGVPLDGNSIMRSGYILLYSWANYEEARAITAITHWIETDDYPILYE